MSNMLGMTAHHAPKKYPTRPEELWTDKRAKARKQSPHQMLSTLMSMTDEG